ncbi:MAG TPA: DUF6502 family protein [Methylocella sp.]
MTKPAITIPSGEPPPALTRAIARILRPLLRVLIAQGITFPVLSRLLKELYVEVAEASFPVPGQMQTDSRINLLTGVHRKDVRVLRGRGREDDLPSPVVSRNAQMIAIWAGAPDFLDARGRPRALPRTGERPSFESLVETISKDIRPRVVLDEWQRLGLVGIDEKGLIQLNSAAFVPREDFADLAYYFGRNLRDHIAASSHNLLGSTPPMLERAVYYEKLTPQSIDELATYARELGAETLVAVNKRAFDLSQRDAAAADASQRMTFGVYFFSAADDPQDAGE